MSRHRTDPLSKLNRRPECSALGLHRSRKERPLLFIGTPDATIFNPDRVEKNLLHSIPIHLHEKEKGEIIALCAVDHVIIHEVTGGIENGSPLIPFDALRGVIGMSPIEVRPQVEHLASQHPHRV